MYYTFWMFMKRKPRENIQVCHNVSPTSYRQVTDILPTHYQLSPDCRPTGSLYFGQNLLAVCRPTVGRLLVDTRPTVGRQTADSWPTVDRQVFWGGLLHNYPYLNLIKSLTWWYAISQWYKIIYVKIELKMKYFLISQTYTWLLLLAE